MVEIVIELAELLYVVVDWLSRVVRSVDWFPPVILSVDWFQFLYCYSYSTFYNSLTRQDNTRLDKEFICAL